MRCNFFSAGADLQVVLEAVETTRSLRYVVAGRYSTPEVPGVGSWQALGSLAKADAILVSEQQFPLEFRSVRQSAGGVAYFVDELQNPSAVTLALGTEVSPRLLLPGMVGTAAKNGPAAALFRAYRSAFEKHFLKVKAYWVGPTAVEYWRAGARLTVSAEASTEFDLTSEAARAV
jgi:hypothetical protein